MIWIEFANGKVWTEVVLKSECNVLKSRIGCMDVHSGPWMEATALPRWEFQSIMKGNGFNTKLMNLQQDLGALTRK
jgi:hypothetical protein